MTSLTAAGDGALSLTASFAPATPPGATSAAIYFTLRNTGDRAATLLRAASSAAATLAVHATSVEGGIARMREVTLVVPAHGTVTLAPGAMHLMAVGLAAPLRAGDRIQLRLVFQDGTVLETTVPVRPPGEPSP